MTPDLVFTICSNVAVVGWILIILRPRWRWTARLVCAVILPGLLGIVYTYLILAYLGDALGGFGSLDDVSILFQNRHALLAGWIHYLAFDLFIGCWEIRDAQSIGLPHLLVVPCLVLTFLLGPIGLILYLTARYVRTRNLVLDNAHAAD